MTETEAIRTAIGILMHDPELRILIQNPPEAIFLPSSDNVSQRFVVNVLLIDEASKLDAFAAFCARVAQLLGQAGVLEDVEGLQITLGTTNSGKPKRAFTVFIESYAMNRAERLTKQDLKEFQPATGIFCRLYCSNLE